MPRRGENIRQRTVTRGGREVQIWVADVALGTDLITGKRVRRSIEGDFYNEVAKEKRRLLGQRDGGAQTRNAKGWTVATWCLHWVETFVKTERHEGTYWSYLGDVRSNIAASPIGRKPLGKLGSPDVDAWKTWLQVERKLAPSTRRRCLTVLRKALGYAKRQKLVAQNVADKDFVDGISVPKREVKALSQRQVHQLLVQSRDGDDANYAMYVLAFATGMREGELLGLKWANDETEPGLDLESGVVRIRQQAIQYRGKIKIVDHVKRDSIRDHYLDDEVVILLRQHHARLLRTQLLAGSRWQESGLVFPTRNGTPQRKANAWRSWKRLLKRAGLPTDFRFHDQRSSAASLAIADGATLFEVSKLLGHRDIRTTANQYGHLFEDGKRAMGQRMGRIVLGELGPAVSAE
jgi:integrase